METLRNLSNRIPCLQNISSRTGIKKEHLLAGMVALAIITIMSTPLGPLITSTLGVIIPLQETLVVLKQVNPSREEMRHLIIFWLVFGILTALDAYSRCLVGFIPLFYTAKFLLLLYMGPYKFRGTNWVYDNVISLVPEDWYVNVKGVDSAVKKAAEVVREGVSEVKEVADKKLD